MIRILPIAGFFASICLIFSTAAPAAENLEIGLARAAITPKEPYALSGYYHARLSDGTLDDLYVRAIVFRQGDRIAALAVCDLIGISHSLSTAAAAMASQRTGIPVDHITLSATHSHTGPSYASALHQHLFPGSKPGTDPYPAQLLETIASTIAQAHKNLRPAQLQTAEAEQKPVVSFNRRFLMRDGTIKTWAKYSDPQVVRAAGPIDPVLSVVGFFDAGSQKPLGSLSTFALHLDTVGGTRFSADYPKFIHDRLEADNGPEFVSIFGTGPCGDINHSDPTRKERNSTAFIGGALADTAAAIWPKLQPVPAHFDIAFENVPLLLQDATAEDIAWARDIVTRDRAGEKIPFLLEVKAYKLLAVAGMRRGGPDQRRMLIDPDFPEAELPKADSTEQLTLQVPVRCYALGAEVALVTLPGEVFVDLGLAIRRRSPFKHTLVIELSDVNEVVYVPTEPDYIGGGYEVVNSATQPGSGEKLVDVAVKLLNQLHQKMPAGK